MNVIPTQNVWFDDVATLAVGEAFDNACKSLQNFGSAVPAIIADLIIADAKNGERDPTRLHDGSSDSRLSTLRFARWSRSSRNQIPRRPQRKWALRDAVPR
jgi:hypothetical protein